MFDLKGKTALITGSTQGIGFAIAKLLSDNGAKVFIHGGTSIEKCKKASDSVKNSTPVCVNLSEKECADELYKKTGPVDILVLNASVQYKKEWDCFTEDEYDAQFNINLRSTYFLMKKYAQNMKRNKWGRIVTIGSVNQYNNHPMLALYGVTKEAQAKLCRNTAMYLAPFGVTVNNVAPGAIETPRNLSATENSELKKSIESKIPCGYFGRPEDISPIILLLCSEEGRYITGADIVADGGMSL